MAKAKGGFKIKRKTKRKKRPRLEFSDAFVKQIGNVMEGGVLGNIRDQKQGDGSPIKANAKPTRDMKSQHGLRQMPLRAFDGSMTKGRGESWQQKHKVMAKGLRVTLTPSKTKIASSRPRPKKRRKGSKRSSAADRSKWAQEKGYTGWLDFSDDMRAAMRAALREELPRLWKQLFGPMRKVKDK